MNDVFETRKMTFFEKFWQPSLPGLPKYAQLREILLSAIRAGYWKAGEKLPSEVELTELTPFSLGTVQRTLRALVDEGVVTRVQGSGTFVAEERTPIDTPLHCRFPTDDASGFLPIFPKVISRKRIAERGPWSGYLGQNGSNIVCLERRLNINGEFNVYSKFYLNADRFGSIMSKPLSVLDRVTLRTLLSGEFNLPITHISQSVLLAKFPSEICKVIGVNTGTTGLVMESVASAGRGNYIYYLESFIPPTKRKLIVS
jgi:GntR family transcriptional regulator